MHIVNCSNYVDSNRTVALRTGVCKQILIFCQFAHKFWYNLSISLVQNISVLDKSINLLGERQETGSLPELDPGRR